MKRILVDGGTIPDVTSVAYDNPLSISLLECTEAQDEQAISDGATVADAPLYSRVTSMNMRVLVHASTASVLRWIIFKSPDNDLSASTLVNGGEVFHGSNDTPTAREFRKNTIAKGIHFMGAANQGSWINVNIRRKTLRRLSSLREGDRLIFAIAKDAAGTTIPIDIMGNIYVRANA